jgi:Transglycosylase SLT domain
MADDIDKFVLEYSVKTDKAIKDLEALNARISDLTRATIQSTRSVSHFASMLARELSHALPAFGEISKVIRDIGQASSVAGFAMIALTNAIKLAMASRDQFNTQRLAGQASGFSGARVHDLYQQLGGGPAGITAQQLQESSIKTQEFLNKFKSDFAGTATERFKLARMGINVNRGTTNYQLWQMLAKRWQAHPELARAEGSQFGLAPDVAARIGQKGIGSPTTSYAEYAKGAENTAKLNAELEKFNVEVSQLLMTLGKALPLLTDMIGGINKAVENAQHPVSYKENKFLSDEGFEKMLKNVHDKSTVGRTAEEAAAAQKEAAEKAAATQKKEEEQKAADAKKNEEQFNQGDEANEDFQQQLADWELAIKAFQASVNTFANAVIDPKRAWAAWAGVTGAMGGLGKGDYTPSRVWEGKGTVSYDENNNNISMGGASGGTGTGGGGTDQYDSIIAAAEAAYPDLPKGMLKAQMHVESHGVNGQTSKTGARGIMQIQPINYEHLKMTDPDDPKQSIFGAAQLMHEFLVKSKGNVPQALTYYVGGYDESGYGKDTREYPSKVAAAWNGGTSAGGPIAGEGDSAFAGPMAAAYDPKLPGAFKWGGPAYKMPTGRGGESPEHLRMMDVFAQIAQNTGIKMDTLMQGRASRGDVQFGLDQSLKKAAKAQYAAEQMYSVPGLTPLMKTQRLQALRDADTHLMNLKNFGASALEHTVAGDRNLTLGQRPLQLVINVQGNSIPEMMERAAQELRSHQGLLANHGVTKMKN